MSPTKPQAAPDINAPEILKLARPAASPLQLPDIVFLDVDVAEQHIRLKNLLMLFVNTTMPIISALK